MMDEIQYYQVIFIYLNYSKHTTLNNANFEVLIYRKKKKNIYLSENK